jgi:hypothetical protein
MQSKPAAGGVHTAKQAPHRPGTAPALGLRAGCVVTPVVEQTRFAKTHYKGVPMSLLVQHQHLREGDERRFGLPFFSRGIGLAWSFLRRLLHDLGLLLLVAVVITGFCGWLVSLPGQKQRPGAGVEHEFADRPENRVAVGIHVAHVWLSQPLHGLAKRESRSLPEQRHDQLRKIFEGEDWRGLFYGFTVQVLQAHGGVESFHFLRYPLREPEDLQELLAVMATAAGSPPKIPTTDYFSTAAVHVVPAGTSPGNLLNSMKTSLLPRVSGMPSP